MALFPGLGSVPEAWAQPLTLGDGITALLAMGSLALEVSWSHATKLVWLLNAFGLLTCFTTATTPSC